jgi:hypothetical protein
MDSNPEYYHDSLEGGNAVSSSLPEPELSQSELDEKASERLDKQNIRKIDEFADLIGSAFDDFRADQPGVNFDQFFDNLFPMPEDPNQLIDYSRVDFALVDRFAKIVWDLPTFSQKGVAKFNELLDAGPEALISFLENTLHEINLLSDVNPPRDVMDKAYELAADLERTRVILNPALGLGRLEALDLRGPAVDLWDDSTSRPRLAYEWRFDGTGNLKAKIPTKNATWEDKEDHYKALAIPTAEDLRQIDTAISLNYLREEFRNGAAIDKDLNYRDILANEADVYPYVVGGVQGYEGPMAFADPEIVNNLAEMSDEEVEDYFYGDYLNSVAEQSPVALNAMPLAFKA